MLYTPLQFQETLTPDQRQLLKLHGVCAAFALGVPFSCTRASWDVQPDDDPEGRWERFTFKPLAIEDAWDFEESVWRQLDHIHNHVSDPRDFLQAEVGYDEWRDEDFRRMQLGRYNPPPWKRVSFGDRTGYFAGRTIFDIPVVVTRDVSKVVLRPRWPQTDRLVQEA